MLSTTLFPITGYVRFSESSFCMDNCSIYYLENENGEFLTNVTQLDSIEVLNDYINRFVDIEGDTVQCVECEAINVTSIAISDDCQMPVNCFVDPCLVSECTSYPDAECVANYCGGCWADYYLDGELINCDLSMDCVDLTGIEFGPCDMVLGIGWINDNCEYISGCDWVADSVDYTASFFNSMDDCIEACFSASNDEINQSPHTFNLYNNYPNPFNPVTSITYNIEDATNVTIRIYDLLGHRVKTLVNEKKNPGSYLTLWDGLDQSGAKVASGFYICRLETDRFTATKKMLLLK